MFLQNSSDLADVHVEWQVSGQPKTVTVVSVVIKTFGDGFEHTPVLHHDPREIIVIGPHRA